MKMEREVFDAFIEGKAWIESFTGFAQLGPIAGILLTMIEAFIPILPLSLFVSINVLVYGFWQGYIYSWIGSVIGTISAFFLIKRFGTGFIQNMAEKNVRLRKTFVWIKEHGFLPIFILLSFPFTPSFLISGLSALAGVKNISFIYSIIFGKLIMILSLSYIGYNIKGFFNQPVKSIIMIVITIGYSFVGKFILQYFKKI